MANLTTSHLKTTCNLMVLAQNRFGKEYILTSSPQGWRLWMTGKYDQYVLLGNSSQQAKTTIMQTVDPKNLVWRSRQ